MYYKERVSRIFNYKNMNLNQKIESYLFYTGESVAIKRLAKIFEVGEHDVRNAVQELKDALQNRGVVLMEQDGEVMLATHPEMSDMIMSLKKQELSDPLSKGALETLALILYKDGATKPEIDFIRGVNSGFMLRNLLIRGLIEKTENPLDKRVAKYRATFEALQFLGITSIHELPQFNHFTEELAKRESVSDQAPSNIFTD